MKEFKIKEDQINKIVRALQDITIGKGLIIIDVLREIVSQQEIKEEKE